jgi:hypothetical protein
VSSSSSAVLCSAVKKEKTESRPKEETRKNDWRREEEKLKTEMKKKTVGYQEENKKE